MGVRTHAQLVRQLGDARGAALPRSMLRTQQVEASQRLRSARGAKGVGKSA